MVGESNQKEYTTQKGKANPSPAISMPKDKREDESPDKLLKQKQKTKPKKNKL